MSYYHVTIFPVYWGYDTQVVLECLDRVFDATELVEITRVIKNKEVLTVLAWTDKSTSDVPTLMRTMFPAREWDLNQSFVPGFHQWREQYIKLQARVQTIPYERAAALLSEVVPADRCGW